MGILSVENLLRVDVVVPATVEKLCPGLQRKLMDHGAKVYLPAHGFASGSRASRQSDEFFVYLDMFMRQVRESMASCEEIASAVGNALGILTTKLWRDEEKDQQQIDVAHKIGQGITRLRGRDPEVGRKTREGESVWAPLNKGKHVPPREDNLSALLCNLDHPILQDIGLRQVILQLKRIVDTEGEQRPSLIRELGATTILHQIAGMRRGRRDFLFDLRFYLRDENLQYLVSLGMKEAFKMLIVLDEGLLQLTAAKVVIHYPQDCSDLSLRGIPAHHHIEKMIQQRSGGKVAVFPELAEPDPKIPEFLKSWGPFNSPRYASRTPLSPAQCLVPVSKTGAQRSRGLLVTLAVLPKDATKYVPIGDGDLAAKMTALVNERLARNHRRVICRIEPLRPYGDVMDIGDLPRT